MLTGAQFLPLLHELDQEANLIGPLHVEILARVGDAWGEGGVQFFWNGHRRWRPSQHRFDAAPLVSAVPGRNDETVKIEGLGHQEVDLGRTASELLLQLFQKFPARHVRPVQEMLPELFEPPARPDGLARREQR